MLQIRRTPNGKIQAKRSDGKPLTAKDKAEAKRLAEKQTPACWNCDGPMTPITDINEQPTYYCEPCTVSSDNIHAVADMPRACVVEEIRVEGELKAVKICSFVLESHLWVLYDHSFFPPDGEPVFFQDELVFLAKKSIDVLKEIIKVKIVFPRSRVMQ